MLQDLTKEVASKYKQDKVAAGVVVAWLADRGTYYCSIRRYGLSAKRILRVNVVTSYESTTYEAAIAGLKRNWDRLIRLTKPLPSKHPGCFIRPSFVEDASENWEEFHG